MSSSYNFKDNLTIDNNKYLKWLDITGTSRANIISLDNSNNVKLNSAFGDLFLNSQTINSYTFFNVNGNSGGVIVGSKLGIGFNTTSNVNSLLTLNKDNFIGINTTQDNHNGFLGLAGSSSLLNTTGSRIILYGIDNSSNSGKLNLYSGNNVSYGNINLHTGNDQLRFQILNDGTANFLPNGITSRLIINDQVSTFTNDLILSSSTESINSSTGALQIKGGIGIQGNLYVDGTINFDSSQPSLSYTSGAISISGGIGVSNTENSSSVTSGGALSIAGGASIGKDLYIGGKCTILDSTLATSSQTASLILYGGLGINSNILSRSDLSSQIKLAPITEGQETSISFYSKNNFSETSNTGSSWTLGHNVNSSIGNFVIKNSQYGNILRATYDGNLYMPSNITIENSTNSVNVDNGGALTVLGGASFKKDVYIGGPSLKIPVGTTSERPNLAENGFIRYNSETNEFEGYGPSNTWGSLGGSGGGGGGGGGSISGGNIIAGSITLGVSNIYSGSFTPSNNVITSTNVTGLAFNNSNVRSFTINLTVSVIRTSGGNLYEYFLLEGNQTNSGWDMLISSISDVSGFDFTITSSGQIQYTSTNITNYQNSTIRYHVNQISNAGTYNDIGLQSQGSLITNTIQILSTQDINIGTNNGALYVEGGVRIDKTLYVAGNVGIGVTSPSYALHITGDIASTGDIISFTSISDKRLKQNIETLTNIDALEMIKSLRPVYFEWKEDIFNKAKRLTKDVGFIAQEIEQIIPYAISEYKYQDNTYKNIKYERLIPYLVSSIQYLEDLISKQQEQINQLQQN